MISTFLIAFLKPKQEEQELTEEIAEHLSHELEYQYNMVSDLAKTKQTFIRNLQHETNTPVTGIYSMSQALSDCYDKLSDNDRKKAINTIMSSSERLISYVNNLVDVSKLSNLSKNLNIRKVNLSNLTEEVIRKCRKLYIPKDKEDDREITVNIEPNLYTNCDEYYIRKSYENIVINAIQYCKKGTIDIVLEKKLSNIKLTVKDSGIGIPEVEKDKIFEPFEVSSKTLTPAGGRGMGLTLVKAVAEAHNGSVSVKSEDDSKGSKGNSFVFEVPIDHISNSQDNLIVIK
jgi:signal transduction histidine kinase